MTGYEYFEQVLKDRGLKAYDVSKATGIMWQRNEPYGWE